MREAEDLEHVTRYFYRHKDDFRILNFESPHYHNHIRLSVDTPRDMETFTSLIRKMNRPHWSYSLDDILDIYFAMNVNTKKGRLSQ